MVFSGRKEVPYSEIKKGYEIAKDQCYDRKARFRENSRRKYKHHKH